MQELWKEIPGFEGKYEVSNLGRIKSFHKWKRAKCPEEYILKASLANNGYCQVTLYNGNVRKKFLVHRLVAEAFIPNPEGLPHINHKDENRENNYAGNLEWCTPLYNNRYGTAKFRAMMTRGKPVKQCMLSGEWLATYANVTIAEMITGIPRGNIANCLYGTSKSANGFKWEQA